MQCIPLIVGNSIAQQQHFANDDDNRVWSGQFVAQKINTNELNENRLVLSIVLLHKIIQCDQV